MGRTHFSNSSVDPPAISAPLLIAVGLTGLLACAWLPTPVVTAMAILALGATQATLGRFRHSPVFVPIVALHAATYVGLYGLFVGATLHASALVLPRSVWPTLNIAASMVPMAIAMNHVLIGLRQQFELKR